MLIDKFNRKIDYIRVSVTSRCNFRCLYCMPDTPFDLDPKENILSFEEMFEFLKLAIDEGVNKIRITGGEPLLRKELEKFIYMLYSYNKNLDIALTTNGFFLKDKAKILKDAGLKRINISLDTLDQKKFFRIAQKDVFNDVIEGIDEALNVGFKLKLNSVILKNINDNEIIDLLNFAMNKKVIIRFIEYMENVKASSFIETVSSDKVLEIIKREYNYKEIKNENASRYFKMDNDFIFGIIEPHKESFCENCNRIRLTAEGYLIPCLYFDESYQIKEAIRSRDIKRAAEILKEVVKNKPEKNDWNREISNREFYRTGG